MVRRLPRGELLEFAFDEEGLWVKFSIEGRFEAAFSSEPPAVRLLTEQVAIRVSGMLRELFQEESFEIGPPESMPMPEHKTARPSEV